MVIKHNLTAMNANRQLGITNGHLSSTTEKLSSGYKINRAADDAAGLSISEKMRKQIRGLTQGSLNAEDGISYVQTTEGALNEVHEMLQRGRQLAVQAANGTNSESERAAIQAEIDQLKTEIGRIGDTTKFNEQDVFDHSKTTNLVRKSGLQDVNVGQVSAVVFANMQAKSFDENDYAGVVGTIGGTNPTTAAKLEAFGVALRDAYIPKILGTLENSKMFNGIDPSISSGINLGFDLYAGGNNGTLAYLKSNGIGFELAVNTYYLKADAGGNIIFDNDLATTIAHELTHGIMFDVVTNGMLGVGGCDPLPD